MRPTRNSPHRGADTIVGQAPGLRRPPRPPGTRRSSSTCTWTEAAWEAAAGRGPAPQPKYKPRCKLQPRCRLELAHLCLLSFSLLFAIPAAAQDTLRQSPEDQRSKSVGCESSNCHTGIEPMHVSPAVRLGCTDCHGGKANTENKDEAHVKPRNKIWLSSANPERTYTMLNDESFEFVRFMNPGDLRVAGQSCGQSGCHAEIVGKARSSLHDARRVPVGRRALQQRRMARQERRASARATTKTARPRSCSPSPRPRPPRRA